MNDIKNVEKRRTIKIRFENRNCAYLNYVGVEDKKYNVDIILNIEGYKKMWLAHSVVFPAEIDETLVRVDSVEQFEEDLIKWFADCVESGFFSWDGLDELVWDEE